MSMSVFDIDVPSSEISAMRTSSDFIWWSSLRHGGCLIAPSRLGEFFSSTPDKQLAHWEVDRLRGVVTRMQEEGGKEALKLLLNVVLVHLLGLSDEYWSAGSSLDPSWSVKSLSGEIIKPRRLWQEPNGSILPVFVIDDTLSSRSRNPAALGLGRSRRTIARAIEWLRHKNQKVALLTNGFQWRLIHAGADYDAWCEWDIDTWLEEGLPGSQVDALRLLLGCDAVAAPSQGVSSRLVEAILATRRGQADLSTALGERVRQAVELLLRESSPVIDQVRSETAFQTMDNEQDAHAAHSVTNRDVYIAAVRIVMRIVVLLFAESRDLLPRNHPIYHRSYSLQGLIEILDREGGGRPMERLRERHTALPRLLSLFRLLYHGSFHEKLVITRYGGGLFTPGESASQDPVLRALAALESPKNDISDAIVAVMLDLLTHAPVKVRQGRSAQIVTAHVDFSQLDTEYLGILYQGLLDYELRRVEAGIPILFINAGDQPALPLTRLEEMDDKALANLVEKLKSKTKSKAEGAGEEDIDEEGAEAEPEETGDVNADENESPVISEPIAAYPDLHPSDKNDQVRIYRDRAHAWARRAVEAGKLVAKPRGKLTAEKQKAHDSAVDNAAKKLVFRVITPGEYYLVRFGGTRKGSGTFYTKPALAAPTVRRTLKPLAYEGERPRMPAEILSLKVADIASGSGSFLVSALRFLTAALYDALFAHGWLVEHPDGSIHWGNPDPPIPEWFVDFMQDVPGINEPAPRRGDSDAQGPEDRIHARLKRVIVERCIYGVDLDSLAVELARLALWIETMDPYLPFSFLDHKIKCGNSLVGCWFDRFQDYPAMAWEREGGDKNHLTGVHFAKEAWTHAIKKVKTGIVKTELAHALEGLPRLVRGFENPDRLETTGQFNFDLGVTPEQAHDHLVDAYQRLHDRLNTADPERQAQIYRQEFLDNPEVQRLRQAFDLWCSVWFWSADKLDAAPTPACFYNPSEQTRAIAERIAHEMRFFHWEIEFPDVFTGDNPGFSAIVGNPPWDTLQPNSKEWFSNHDPLYRTYGNQEAKKKQTEYFMIDRGVELDWLMYCASFKAMTCWYKHVAEPLDKKWLRQSHASYSDPEHPFRHQGEGKPYTYKMFLELSHALLQGGPLTSGRVGLVVPSGIYTDRGSTDLRTLLLEHCRWEWLFCLENRQKVFEIDSRFKFCPVIVEKGGRTETIRAAFMHHDLADWDEAERHVLDYPVERITQFSPKSKAILEIRSYKDLAILDKMYANGVLLGDNSPDGWCIKYAQGDFNMTSDSKLFPPRPQWEEKGYAADEYGHWLKGKWQPGGKQQGCTGFQPVNHGQDAHATSLIRSRDGNQVIAIDDIEDVALPLYEGRMIGQFDFSQKGWVSGKGRTAVWREIGFEDKVIEPQYLMKLHDHFANASKPTGTKVSHMRIGSATNERSTFATLLDTFAGGDTAAIFWTGNLRRDLDLTEVLDSYAFDWLMRRRLGGLHLDYHVFEQNALPFAHRFEAHTALGVLDAGLSLAGLCFAPAWLSLLDSLGQDARATLLRTPWRRLWAVTPYERLRLRCILDAVVAHLYGLDEDDFRRILRDCDHPIERTTNKAFTRTLDPKGFWRVDKTLNPELRHTVLAQAAFTALKSLIRNHGEEAALKQFFGSGPDDGWMLPETLRLADYDLGHDGRACQPQPAASRLGSRFYDWQLTQSAEDSWAECRMHADKIRCIRETGRKAVSADMSAISRKHGRTDAKNDDDLFGEAT